MEIDLNNAFCNGDCEKNSGCFHCLSSTSSSCSSNSGGGSLSSSIYFELWHAIAGPLTSLLKKGNVVVYFPQGHLEQLAAASPYPPVDVSNFDLQPQVFCKVVDVQLLVSGRLDFFFLHFPFSVSFKGC